MPPVRRSKRAQSPQELQPISRTRSLRPRHQANTPNPPKERKTPKPRTYLQLPAPNHPNLNSNLFRLPLELFNMITAHLDPTDEACLSLTCKEALSRLGAESWSNFSRTDRNFLDFIDERSSPSFYKFLARDHPDLTLCEACLVLHPPLKPPREHQVTKFTRTCFGPDSVMDVWPRTKEQGYSLVHLHIREAFATRPDDVSSNPTIDLFAGTFEFQKGPVEYRLQSSAKWIDGNFILKQEYHLRSSSNKPLKASDITSLPFRVCAHLTTSTAHPQASRYTRNIANGPLLTHAITTAFPHHHRGTVADPKPFRHPTTTEKAQMDAGSREPVTQFIWRCRGCPTKFRVEYFHSKAGWVRVIAWHNFGKDEGKLGKYWRAFVRREGPTLGRTKRNSEFWVPGRGVSDFRVE